MTDQGAVVTDQQQSRPGAGALLQQQFDEILPPVGIQSGGRLVGENQIRPADQGAGGGNPLLLADRQFGGGAMDQRRFIHAQMGEQPLRFSGHRSGGSHRTASTTGGESAGQGHVVPHREVGQQVEHLEDHAQMIELKYLKRGEDSPAQRQKVIVEAETQLQRYMQDARVREVLGPATLHPLVLVYSGWELVYRAEWAEVLPFQHTCG